MNVRQLAETAYTAYRNHSDGKSLATGMAIPEWDDMPAEIQEAWCASADAVGQKVHRTTLITLKAQGLLLRDPEEGLDVPEDEDEGVDLASSEDLELLREEMQAGFASLQTTVGALTAKVDDLKRPSPARAAAKK